MSCEKCKSHNIHPGYREYSADAKALGRAMYEMILNGPLDKTHAVLTAQEARDACTYCRSLVEKDIRLTVFSYNPECDPETAEDVFYEPTVGEVTL